MNGSIVPLPAPQMAAVAPNWSAMRSAIAVCERLDEVKSLSDKAVALRAYYAQSQDVENETAAMRVRLRAERRLGELIASEQQAGRLATPERNPGSVGHVSDDDMPRTLSSLGIPRDRSARAQQLASVPEDQFEAALQSPRPSSRAIAALAHAKMAEQTKPDVEPVLKTWGMIRDFAAATADGTLLNPAIWREHPCIQPFQRAEINDAIPKIVHYLTTMSERIE